MNNLRKLRKELNLTLRDIDKYTGINNTTISFIENGKRKLNQNMINALVSFFNVTTDYLLGKSENGYIVSIENSNEEIVLNESEYIKLSNYITTEIIDKNISSNNITIKDAKDISNIYTSRYVVYRELKGDKKNYELFSPSNELDKLIPKLSKKQKEKLVIFIKEFL